MCLRHPTAQKSGRATLLDLWVFQEILTEIRPALVIELGTYLGGSKLFLAHQLQLLGEGRIISIDNRELNRPQHQRITYSATPQTMKFS